MVDPVPGTQPGDRIATDAAVRFGKPVIRGTRVTVDEVVGLLASGLSKDDVAVEFGIAIADVHAALEYAARSVANERRFVE
ncbi:MAG: DUF433 domain-containing protein [Planctomycetota bacterium]